MSQSQRRTALSRCHQFFQQARPGELPSFITLKSSSLSDFITVVTHYPAHCLPFAAMETADTAISAQVQASGGAPLIATVTPEEGERRRRMETNICFKKVQLIFSSAECVAFILAVLSGGI